MTFRIKFSQHDKISCCYAECRYAQCRYAEYLYAECLYAVCLYAECLYSECPFAECRVIENIRLVRKVVQDKHSRLFCLGVSDEEKKVLNLHQIL